MSETPVARVTGEREWLAEVLTQRIPLGGAMALEIARLDERGIELRAPLSANVNDKGTAFGGALVSLMILAGWSLPRLLLKRQGLAADLVIGRCEVKFIAPVTDDFTVVCDWPGTDERAAFLRGVRERGRGKLALAPKVVAGSEVAASLEARYAALGRKDESQ